MGIKLNPQTKQYDVNYYKRHPKTGMPVRAGRKGIATKAEANRIYAELILQVEGKLQEKIIPRWEKFVGDYREHMLSQGMTGKTADNYYVCLKCHTFEAWGNRTIDTIKTDEIRQLIKDRVGDRAPSHQKNMLKFIRGVFKYAVEKDIIPRNPTPEMKFKVGDKIKKVLTESQVRLLLTKAKEYNWEWYPHVATAIYTGLRNGELYALTWDKVNFENRTMLIDCSWNKDDGFKSTKSGDDRMVEIAPPLMTILKELKLKSEDSVFVLPRITRWDLGLQAEALRLFLAGIGLPGIRFHDLRATWCTIMLSKGVEPAKVMIMGGWKELKTLQVYLRKAGIMTKGITDRLDLHDPAPIENAQVLQFDRS